MESEPTEGEVNKAACVNCLGY